MSLTANLSFIPMKLATIFMLSAALFLVSSVQADETVKKHPTRGDVAGVEGEDPEMLDAQKKAQASLPHFVKAVQNREAGKRYHLKVKLSEGNDIEHVWLEPVKWNHPGLLGVLAVKPVAIKNKKRGDVIAPLPSDITDWVILSEDGSKQGGFTADVIEKRR